MEPRAKILYVNHHSSPMAGAERCLLRVLERIDRKRFEPMLACPDGDLAREAELRDTKVLRLNFLDYQRNRSNFLGRLVPNPILLVSHAIAVTLIGWRLSRIVRKYGVSLIHANNLLARVPSYIAGKMSGIPVIWHIRDILSSRLWLSIYDRLAVHGIAGIITVSDACRRQFTDQSIISTVYDGISTDVFCRNPKAAAAARLKFGWDESNLVLGIFGRVSPSKGHALFVDAAETIHRLYLSTRWLIVGEAWSDADKEFLSEILGRASRGELRDHLLYAGFQEDLVSVMSACDVVVVPSIIQDSFPNTLLEGMACSRAVLAFPVGGIPEAIEDGISGILVHQMDADGLAEATKDLIENPSLMERLGVNARQRVMENFNSTRTQKEIEKVYAAVLEKGLD